MRFSLFTCLIILVFISSTGCDTTVSPIDDYGRLFYSKSFDNKADTDEWRGISFSGEAPVGGGTGSAYVSNGCVVPPSDNKVRIHYNGVIKVKIWAKLLYTEGNVIVKNTRTGESISIIVSDTEWNKITSEKGLIVQKGDELEISLFAGGFNGGAMLITHFDLVYMY